VFYCIFCNRISLNPAIKAFHVKFIAPYAMELL
jgi:hypothetical protein